MLMNNLDEEVAERPQDLVVYGGTGKAARNWDCYHAIVGSLKNLENDETLLVQSGQAMGVFKTHEYAPRVLIANSNLVGHFSNWEKSTTSGHLANIISPARSSSLNFSQLEKCPTRFEFAISTRGAYSWRLENAHWLARLHQESLVVLQILQ